MIDEKQKTKKIKKKSRKEHLKLLSLRKKKQPKEKKVGLIFFFKIYYFEKLKKNISLKL